MRGLQLADCAASACRLFYTLTPSFPRILLLSSDPMPHFGSGSEQRCDRASERTGTAYSLKYQNVGYKKHHPIPEGCENVGNKPQKQTSKTNIENKHRKQILTLQSREGLKTSKLKPRKQASKTKPLKEIEILPAGACCSPRTSSGTWRRRRRWRPSCRAWGARR